MTFPDPLGNRWFGLFAGAQCGAVMVSVVVPTTGQLLYPILIVLAGAVLVAASEASPRIARWLRGHWGEPA